MATFNGGRMVALFLCMLFANVSFAQRMHVFYMEDPVDEEKAEGVLLYEQRWQDPLAWVDFDAHFTPAREAQEQQIRSENARRVQAAINLLNSPVDYVMGEGIDAWVPSPFPLGRFPDSLFSFIANPDLPDSLRGIDGITLREFILADAWEPGRNCLEGERCAQAKRLYSHITSLIDKHGSGTRIISLRFKATTDTTKTIIPPIVSYVEELETGDPEEGGGTEEAIGLVPHSVELMRPAAMGKDEWWIDTPPYGDLPPYATDRSTPVGKPVVSETSSWGRIKAVLAD